MTIIHDEHGIVVVAGSAYDVIPGWLTDASVDAVIVDPPYGIDKNYGRSQLGQRTIAGDDDMAANMWMVSEAWRMLKDDTWLAIFADYEHVGQIIDAGTAVGFGLKTVVVWDKRNPGLGSGIRNEHEEIVLLRKGSPVERWQGGNVWDFFRGFGRPEHPHQKPLTVMRRLVEYFSPPHGLVVDPFCGSGSTLVACKELGRRGFGVEIDPDHADLACRRIREATVGLMVPVPVHQPSLFGEVV